MLPHRLRRVLELLTRLPGVGERTAQRYALFLAGEHPEVAADLGQELSALGQHLGACERCGNLADVSEDGVICSVCRDNRRNPELLCVVHRVQDLLALERSGAMRGRYFVLGRLLSPLDGVGPEELPTERLVGRIESDGVREVILATPASVDGEATALYLGRELGKKGLRITRIASGIPHGGDIEFADQVTLGRAIEGRRSIE